MEAQTNNSSSSSKETSATKKSKSTFLNRLFKKVRNLFNTPEPISQSTHFGIDDEFARKIYFDLDNKFQYFLNHPKLDSNFTLFKSFMFKLGYFDGVNGKSLNNINVLAKVYAGRLIDQVRSFLEGEKNSILPDLEKNKDLRNRMSAEDCLKNDHYRLLNFYKNQFPKTFSLFLFCIYFIVAIFLFLADIPLAVELIKNGLNLSTVNAYDIGDISNLFTGINGEVGFNWEVLFNNWEVFFTALGIALFTVYIKIFFDEYVATPYGHQEITEIKYEKIIRKELNQTESIVADVHTSLKKSKKRSSWILIIKLVILLTTILSILILSIFRAETYSTLLINSADVVMTEAQTENPEIPYKIILAAFICITIMFPVISGICLSYSLTCLQNRINFWRSKRQSRMASNQFLKASGEFTKTDREFQRLKSELEMWQSSQENNLEEKYAETLLCFYHNGFNAGYTNPDYYTHSLDFFQKVELWQNKSIAKNINFKINTHEI